MQKVEVMVLGTGPAGSTAAKKCRKAGRTVGIVDSRPYGGTCALRGCNPKKVLARAAELIDWLDRMDGSGIHRSNAQIDWPELIEFKRTFTVSVPADREETYRKAGIELFHGRAKFISPKCLVVNDQEIEYDNVVVATGSVPVTMGIAGEEHLIDSEAFMELEQLPKRLIFIGGGYITFEFAHIAVRAGAEVTIVERNERSLMLFDSDLVECLVDRTRQLGVDIITSTGVTSIEKQSDGSFTVSMSDGEKTKSIEADLVIHGAGRVPDIEGLGLEAADIRYGRKGIEVNEYLQSVSNLSVYAGGDVAASGSPLLSPIAIEEGRILAQNIINGNHRVSDYGPVATAVFSVPAIASVGLGENEAKIRGLDFELLTGDRSKNNSMKKVAAKHALYKILVERSTDRILGVHLLGPDAAETINLFALAIKFGITATELKSTLLAFPTFANDVRGMV